MGEFERMIYILHGNSKKKVFFYEFMIYISRPQNPRGTNDSIFFGGSPAFMIYMSVWLSKAPNCHFLIYCFMGFCFGFGWCGCNRSIRPTRNQKDKPKITPNKPLFSRVWGHLGGGCKKKEGKPQNVFNNHSYFHDLWVYVLIVLLTRFPFRSTELNEDKQQKIKWQEKQQKTDQKIKNGERKGM